MLDDQFTGLQRLAIFRKVIQNREVDAPVLHDPTAVLRELDHVALAVEEEERLGRGDGQARVGLLARRGDLFADLVGKDLRFIS